MRLKEMQYRLSQAIFHRKPYGEAVRVIGGEEAFAVYRNNVFVSLINTLQSLYPLTAKASGDAFKNTARHYIETHPPSAPHLLHYGGDFPAFIAADDGLLGSIGEVEKLCNLSYAAPKQACLTAEVFLTYEDQARLKLPVKLTASCLLSPPLPRVLAEALCADEIGQTLLTQARSDKAIAHVLITRPLIKHSGDSVLKTCISAEEAAFLHDIQQSGFESALVTFIETCPDPMQRLAHFLTVGSFALK